MAEERDARRRDRRTLVCCFVMNAAARVRVCLPISVCLRGVVKEGVVVWGKERQTNGYDANGRRLGQLEQERERGRTGDDGPEVSQTTELKSTAQTQHLPRWLRSCY